MKLQLEALISVQPSHEVAAAIAEIASCLSIINQTNAIDVRRRRCGVE